MVSSLKERATNYYDQVSKAITNFSSEYSFKEYEEVDKSKMAPDKKKNMSNNLTKNNSVRGQG